MGDELLFDERAAEALDAIYRTRDVRRRRALALEALDPQPGETTAMDPETFGGYLPLLIRGYVAGLEDVPDDEADAWVQDLQDLDERDAYFFAFVQFCFTATRQD